MTSRAACLFLLCVPGLLAQQFDIIGHPFPDTGNYNQYGNQPDSPDYYDYQDATQSPDQQFQFEPQEQQRNSQQEAIQPFQPTFEAPETEPTEPGPLDCREEQYPCTRLYSVHKPCKQCLNEICFYSLRRVYVINREVCVRTVCAHEELLRADLCRDKFSRCGVMATSGLCQSVGTQCTKSCGGC
ncbi:microfibrillar-associated protein 2 isoform X2 [Ambystoma mexicanum]